MPLQLPQTAWSTPTETLLEQLEVDPSVGLSDAQVDARRESFGANILDTAKPRSAWRILINQFQNLVILLLAAAAGTALAFGDHIEALAIALVIAINAAIGFVMELRAVRSMEALRTLADTTSRARRGGHERMIPAGELVPGDILKVQAGDIVSSDLRLLNAQNLQVDESVLTGESMPVEKQTEAIEADAPLAERSNMLFKGTALTRGDALALVVATGMATELGRITKLVQGAQQVDTPLEARINKLAQKLVWVCLALAGAIAGVGIFQARPLQEVIETAVALAVATIPEGLPIVTTIALARGMWRMSRRNALVRNLAAVETLGSTSVIVTDKTGTLTENQMTVERISTPCGPSNVAFEAGGAVFFDDDSHRHTREGNRCLQAALEIGVLCNTAQRRDDSDPGADWVGDPVEISLMQVARGAGLSREELLADCPLTREESFDASVKMMATFHRVDERWRVAVKGAPEAVLNSCTRVMSPDADAQPISQDARRAWTDKSEALARRGLRLLGLAQKWCADERGAPYEELTFVGLVAFVDPPRADVGEAIRACKAAGIRVVMLTGDHPATALHIAQQIDLAGPEDVAITGTKLRRLPADRDDSRTQLLHSAVFARVSPEQKLDIITLYQKQGAVVAMTGDGVNDAPALTRADIGIAMGQRGTQVAREASDIVLQDDAFSTIIMAVEQGRVIFENIRKFVVYLLSCNISELFVVGIASLAFSHLPLPITALQILFLNLVTDVFPALALGWGEGDGKLLQRPPRERQEPVLTRRHWAQIVGWGSLITLSVLGVYFIAHDILETRAEMAVTMSFLTLAFAQLWHVFNMRTANTPRLYNDITRNPWVWGALVLCIVITLLAVYIPPIAQVLSVIPPGLREWQIILAASLLPVVVGWVRK